MSKFRKKPVEIEAIQYTGKNDFELSQWSLGSITIIPSPVLEPTDDNPTGSYLQIKTREGLKIAIVGDWIIKGIQGEFYPCRPDIFSATYEPVL